MFSSLIGIRGAGIALALISPLAMERADAACRNIVVSEDAQYMVLDPETLATLHVGNLQWLGIYSGGFRVGSSFERALFSSSHFLRVNSDVPVLERDMGSGSRPAYTQLYLENMGEDLRSQNEVPVMELQPRPPPYGRVQWADWIQENTLIREIYDRDQHYIEGYELLDTDFNVLRRWEPRVGFSLEFPSCVIGDRIYFAGMRGVHVFDDQGGTTYELEDMRNEGLRLVPPHTKNCMALAFRDTPDDDPMRGAMLVDIVGGTLGPEFAVRKFGEYILFDGGRRLLQQKQEGRVVVEGSRRYGSSGDHTNQFSLIDTTTGEVLLERELQTGAGALSREMLCDDETPRALVKDEGAFYLIDPYTLEIVASKVVPSLWGGVYYVSE